MEKPIAVIAFGGNAILDKGDDGSFETQLEKAKTACREMLSILHKGYDICLVHGNGPQVGNLLIQFEKARDIIPVPPLDVAVASSQGLRGHMLEVSTSPEAAVPAGVCSISISMGAMSATAP